MHAWVCACRPSIPLGACILGRRASPEPFPLGLVPPQKELLGWGAVLWDRRGPAVTCMTRGESFLGAGLPATLGLEGLFAEATVWWAMLAVAGQTGLGPRPGRRSQVRAAGLGPRAAR